MKNKGFTLIEILVTTTIFVSIFGIISGLFFSALKVQRKAMALQGLIKESSYVMEYMSRQLRMVKKDDMNCTDPSEPKNYFINPDKNSVSFKNYNDECWKFYLDEDEGRLKIDRAGKIDFLTSADLNVLSFKINLLGDVNGDEAQPRITFVLKIQGNGQKTEEKPTIQIQTTVSQRNLDI